MASRYLLAVVVVVVATQSPQLILVGWHWVEQNLRQDWANTDYLKRSFNILSFEKMSQNLDFRFSCMKWAFTVTLEMKCVKEIFTNSNEAKICKKLLQTHLDFGCTWNSEIEITFLYTYVRIYVCIYVCKYFCIRKDVFLNVLMSNLPFSCNLAFA